MKSLFRLVAGLGLATCLGLTAAELSNASFALGPKGFREGDTISIERVSCTSPHLALGDTVMVHGHYHLTSQEKANLSLFLTQTEGDGRERLSPAQTMEITKGSGEFELRYEVKHPGALHVSFYSTADGKSFGGVYFGTEPQMKKIKDWTVDH